MARKRIVEGPIGNGWIDEVKTDNGIRFVARWKKFVADPEAPEGRRRINGGQYEIGPKVYHGPGLKSKKDAEKEWLKVCDSVMGRSRHLSAPEKARKTFRWFEREDPDGFRKTREARWKGKTPDWYDYIMSKVLPRFGDVQLKDMREADMQKFLNQLATDDFSECVVKNAKLYLNAVLNAAWEQRIIEVNPARNLIIPVHTRKPNRPFVTVEEFQTMLAGASNARDRLMLEMLYIGGFRKGELFGLYWRDFNGSDTVFVERQLTEELKLTPLKTDGSAAPVAVPREIAAGLNEWKKWCPTASDPNGFIFPSPRKKHINPGYWRKKVLIPLGETAGITMLSFHAFRRGLATEAHEQGMTDKNLQSQMRHGEIGTTQRSYIQRIPKAQHESVQKFYNNVVPMPGKGAA